MTCKHGVPDDFDCPYCDLKVKEDDFRPAIVLDDVSGVNFESLIISDYNEESIYLNNCPDAVIDIK